MQQRTPHSELIERIRRAIEQGEVDLEAIQRDLVFLEEALDFYYQSAGGVEPNAN